MASQVLQLQGSDAAIDKLLALDTNQQKATIRDAMKYGSDPMLASIQRRAPRRSGLLSHSLKISVCRGDRPGRFAVRITASSTREQFALSRLASGRVGHAQRVAALGGRKDKYKVYYALMVEAGHKARGGGRVPPHPFAKPGFDATVDQTATEIMDRLVNNIEHNF